MERRNKNSVDKKEKFDDSIRLNKYLAEAGVASRRKADEYITQGRVKVNGKIIVDLGTKIKISDNVTVDGDPVALQKNNIYIVLNKPKDVITTTDDELDRKTVMDIVKKRARIYPIGRLDRNTTGVLLLTNDGDMAYRLTHPKYRIERIYNVGLNKKLDLEHAKTIAWGVELEDGKTDPCEVFVHPEDKTKVTILIHEGKNREVRRIFEFLGYEVKKLDRKSFANITTSGLGRGEYRYLERKELLNLRRLVGL